MDYFITTFLHCKRVRFKCGIKRSLFVATLFFRVDILSMSRRCELAHHYIVVSCICDPKDLRFNVLTPSKGK